MYNFIKFCRLLQVMEVVMFETEDLVSQKNEKHVVLTLLEVARRGAKIGMLAPMVSLTEFFPGRRLSQLFPAESVCCKKCCTDGLSDNCNASLM